MSENNVVERCVKCGWTYIGYWGLGSDRKMLQWVWNCPECGGKVETVGYVPSHVFVPLREYDVELESIPVDGMSEVRTRVS